MSRGLRTLLTMTVLVAVLIAGTWYGIRLLVDDPPGLPEADTQATCRNRTVEVGEQITPNQVRVDVLNASGQSGLANRTMINLESRGFLPGSIANAPEGTEVKNVQILSEVRKRLDARLVGFQFRAPRTFAGGESEDEAGVVVIIGNNFRGLRKRAPSAIKAKKKITLCVPLVAPATPEP